MVIVCIGTTGVAAGIARDTRTVMLDKGEKLHRRLQKESKILQDHRYHLKVYPKSFTGKDFTNWLVEIGEAGDTNEGVRLGQALLESGVIHHGTTCFNIIVLFYFFFKKYFLPFLFSYFLCSW